MILTIILICGICGIVIHDITNTAMSTYAFCVRTFCLTCTILTLTSYGMVPPKVVDLFNNTSNAACYNISTDETQPLIICKGDNK